MSRRKEPSIPNDFSTSCLPVLTQQDVLLDVLREGHIDDVIKAARASGEHGSE